MNCQISKGLKKHRDNFGVTKEGNLPPKNTLCIEIFGQAERRNPEVGEASVFLAMVVDCQRGKLQYLENRGNVHLQVVTDQDYLFAMVCSWWCFPCGVKFSMGNQSTCYFLFSSKLCCDAIIFIFTFIFIVTFNVTQCSCFGEDNVSEGGQSSNGLCSSG
jgi:hypothetical protein